MKFITFPPDESFDLTDGSSGEIKSVLLKKAWFKPDTAPLTDRLLVLPGCVLWFRFEWMSKTRWQFKIELYVYLETSCDWNPERWPCDLAGTDLASFRWSLDFDNVKLMSHTLSRDLERLFFNLLLATLPKMASLDLDKYRFLSIVLSLQVLHERRGPLSWPPSDSSPTKWLLLGVKW